MGASRHVVDRYERARDEVRRAVDRRPQADVKLALGSGQGEDAAPHDAGRQILTERHSRGYRQR